MPLTRKIITKATTAPETRRVWNPPSQGTLKLLRSDFDRLTNSDKAAYMRGGGLIVNTAAEANVGLPASFTATLKANPAPRRPSYHQR
jgi:hypothetical protein